MLDWFEELVREKVDYHNITFERFEGDDIHEILQHIIEKKQIDWIAMSKSKKSFWERIWNPSQTNKMLYHTHIPLIAFHSESASGEGDF